MNLHFLKILEFEKAHSLFKLIFKAAQLQKVPEYDIFQNTLFCTLATSMNLAQFVFTTSKTELDYHHQKVNVRVTSRVAERLKTKNLRKLGNFKKIPEILGFDGEYPAVTQKPDLDIFGKKF